MSTRAATKTSTLSVRIWASWNLKSVDFSSTRSDPMRARP